MTPETTPTEAVVELPLHEPQRFGISEIFRTIQGEGRWSGSLMTFIRFAGCNVGKPYTYEARQAQGLHMYQTRCCDWTGTGFPCDTDYRVKERLTADEILHHDLVYNARIVLITGGEPLMHAEIDRLIPRLLIQGCRVHVETSGTRDIGPWRNNPSVWVSVSPKDGCKVKNLYLADEIKVLVGADFDEAVFMHRFGLHLAKVRLSPINGEHSVDDENLARCIELVHRLPVAGMSTQMHKYWKVR